MTGEQAATLPRLLALPVFLAASALGVWLAGDSPSARVANVELLWKLAGPLCAIVGTLSTLRNGSERAWVLPPPFMLWLVFGSQRAAVVPWPALLLAHAAALVVLFACWQRRRALAQWAVVGCGVAVAWIQLQGG